MTAKERLQKVSDRIEEQLPDVGEIMPLRPARRFWWLDVMLFGCIFDALSEDLI